MAEISTQRKMGSVRARQNQEKQENTPRPPWTPKRHTLRLVPGTHKKESVWMVQHKTQSGWSEGLFATDFIISLWLDLEEARAEIKELKKELKEAKNE
jgi:hypothetical protein